MENNINDVNYIAWQWIYFTVDILNENKFDIDTFLELFNESFAVFHKYSCENCIHREVMEMYKGISTFLGTRFNPVSHEHSAACELTDAMLTHCLCGGKKETLTTKGVWSFLRDDIEVDFADAEDELFRWTITIEKLSDIGIW